MDQSRIEELKYLLQEAKQEVVIRRGSHEHINVATYRANLQASRETYNLDLQTYMALFDPEIENRQIRERVLDFIETELASYVQDGKIHSATIAFLGGHSDGSPVHYILRNLIRRTIVDGEETAALAFAECTTNTSCVFYDYHLLYGLRVSKEVEVFDGIRLIPLSNAPEHLPAYLPKSFGRGMNVLKVENLLSKTLLRIDCEVSPVFHKPAQGYTLQSGPDAHFEIALKSKDVPKFDLSTFFQALSLECRCSVRAVARWTALDFYEIFDLGLGTGMGGAWSSSWSLQDAQEARSRTVSDSELDEARQLYGALIDLPRKTKDALRVPIDRWTKSNGQRDPVDKMIDLGIAFESLYLSDSDYRAELRFRFALRASWHLGENQPARESLLDEFLKIYDWRSRAVHTGKLESRRGPKSLDPNKRGEFIDRAQELCSQSIRSIIVQRDLPNWKSLVLGAD